MRTYKKTYVRKKTGEIVTKTYTTRRVSKMDILVDSEGIDVMSRGKKTRIQRYIESFENPEDRARVKNVIRQLKRDQKFGDEITTRTVESRIARDSRDKMLINAGYTVEEAVRELGTTEEEFYDERNWSRNAKGRIGSRFTNAAGVTFEFNFRYTGSVWKRI